MDSRRCRYPRSVQPVLLLPLALSCRLRLPTHHVFWRRPPLLPSHNQFSFKLHDPFRRSQSRPLRRVFIHPFRRCRHHALRRALQHLRRALRVPLNTQRRQLPRLFSSRRLCRERQLVQRHRQGQNNHQIEPLPAIFFVYSRIQIGKSLQREPRGVLRTLG